MHTGGKLADARMELNSPGKKRNFFSPGKILNDASTGYS
jgi:hypothetical protein